MLQGLSVSPGLAVGRAVIIRFGRLPAFRRAVGPEEFEKEERRLRRAAARAAEELARHAGEPKGDMGSELSAILEAHSLIALDETYLGGIVERIRRDRVNAEWALAEVTRELGARLAAADSAALREREADIADVAREIAAHLSDGERPGPRELPRGSILVADELSPVEASRLDPRRVRALALERGGPTSHASIIARSFGLPAVVGIPGLCEAVSPERPIIVDGDRGIVEAHPTRVRIRRAVARVLEDREKSRRQRGRAARAAATRDGVSHRRARQPRAARGDLGARALLGRGRRPLPLRVPVPAGLAAGRPASRNSARPTRRCSPRPRRTRSSCGPTISAARRGSRRRPARTPPSGLRGIRYCLAHPELFEEQLTALCLASRKGDLRILLPMVTSLSELQAARKTLEAVAARNRLQAGAAARRDGRGAFRSAPGRPAGARGGLLLDRHQRPHAVRPGGRPREPRRLGGLPSAAPRDPENDPVRRRGGARAFAARSRSAASSPAIRSARPS